jgi:hypothetical protein
MLVLFRNQYGFYTCCTEVDCCHWMQRSVKDDSKRMMDGLLHTESCRGRQIMMTAVLLLWRRGVHNLSAAKTDEVQCKGWMQVLLI